MKKTKEILSILTLLPVLFISSNYIWIIKYLIHLFLFTLSSYNFIYLNIDDNYELVEFSKEIIEKAWNILLSENQGSDGSYSSSFNKSVNRIRDFINIAKKDGSGSYPEDFHYQGYRKDDDTVTHSKVPGDWGIDELFNFGEYSDLGKRKESAAQMAVWLEYDHRVNLRAHVALLTNDPTFNSSGTKWFQDYCKANNLSDINMLNTLALRDTMRDMSAGK